MRTLSPGSRSAAPPAAKNGGAVKRIALIEDDADIAYTIRLNLRKEKRYQVEHYVSGVAALSALQEKPFDLVILDLNLPDIDGLALCRELRRADDAPRAIIMLTRVEERDKLLGFEIARTATSPSRFDARLLVDPRPPSAGRWTSEEEIFLTARSTWTGPVSVGLNGERVHLTRRSSTCCGLIAAAGEWSRATPSSPGCGLRCGRETRTVDVHIGRSAASSRRADRAVVGLGYRYRDSQSP